MFVRQVKRKCNVRGCKSTDCFAIARTREVGNTVIICKSCLGKALGAVDEIDPKTKSNIPAIDHTAVPPLFFNAKAQGAEAVQGAETAQTAEAKADSSVMTESGQENTGSQETADGDTEQSGGGEPDGDTADTDNTGDTVSPEADEEFKCSVCGKAFESEKGLKTHLRYCKPQTEK